MFNFAHNLDLKAVVVTGIGTDVGKTVVSAILTKALGSAYWKPVQSGNIDGTDSGQIIRLVPEAKIIPESFSLKAPLSPHAAAALEEVSIDMDTLRIPEVEGRLIIEGAGGLMVPLNDIGDTFLDLVVNWGVPVILVSRHYLGSINHTLLTIAALREREVEIAGLIFVGEENKATESIIQKIGRIEVLGRVPIVREVNELFVNEQADLFKKRLCKI